MRQAKAIKLNVQIDSQHFYLFIFAFFFCIYSSYLFIPIAQAQITLRPNVKEFSIDDISGNLYSIEVVNVKEGEIFNHFHCFKEHFVQTTNSRDI